MKQDSFEKKLAAYAAMASAFLATPKESDGQIVYNNVNPDIIVGSGNITESYFLDLNGDGISDFEFKNVFSSSTWSSTTSNENILYPLGNNNLALYPGSSSGVVVLNVGDTIGPNQNWNDNQQWVFGINGYVGLELEKNGNTYYGWARLYSPPSSTSLTVKEYAINLTPDSPIVIGYLPCLQSNPAPTINWNGSQITSTGNGTPQWFFNGDTLSGYNANNISPPAEGTYKVIYTDGVGCNAQSLTFYYVSCDSFQVEITSDAVGDTICPEWPNWVQYSAVESNNSFIYQWQRDGVDIPNANLATLFTSASYDITLIATYPLFGCSDTSNVIHIYYYTPLPLPEIIFQNDTLFCSNDSAFGYDWFVPGVGWTGINQQFIVPIVDGNYRVRIISIYGCKSASYNFNWTHCSYLQYFPLTNLGAQYYCDGAVVDDSLIVQFDSSYQYQWYGPGGAIPFSDTNLLHVNSVGYYHVRITDTTTGCIAYSSNSILLSYVQYPSPFIIQSNDTLFTISGMNAYQWYMDGDSIAGATENIFVITQAGNYSVSLANEIGCNSTSPSVYFSPCLFNNSILVQNNDAILCNGESTILFLQNGTSDSIQWMMNANPIAGANNSFITVNSSGAYSVLLIQDSACSLITNSIAVTVIVSDTPVINVSGDTLFSSIVNGNQWYENSVLISGATNSFYVSSGNGVYYVMNVDSAGCVSHSNLIVLSSVNEIENSFFEYSVNGKEILLQIKNQDWLGAQLNFYNVIGQVIYSGKIKSEITKVDLQNTSGMVFMKIQNGDESRNEKILLR